MKEKQVSQASVTGSSVLPLEPMQAYLFSLKDLGALEGRLGQQTLIPELEPVVDILHQILAGAELKINVEVIREPDTHILQDLEEKRREAEKKANELNAMLGMSYALS